LWNTCSRRPRRPPRHRPDKFGHRPKNEIERGAGHGHRGVFNRAFRSRCATLEAANIVRTQDTNSVKGHPVSDIRHAIQLISMEPKPGSDRPRHDLFCSRDSWRASE
jgi:hypothetical protein